MVWMPIRRMGFQGKDHAAAPLSSWPGAELSRDTPVEDATMSRSSGGDPTVFTTYERFTDQASMDAHNNAAAVAPLLRNHTADPCRRCRTGDLRGDLSQDRLT
jgi:hypothetical protein